MPRLSKEDLAVIKTCFTEKGWRGRRMVREFPNKGWSHRTIDNAIQRLLTTGSILQESHVPQRTVTNDNNQALIEELLKLQESQPGTKISQRQMAKQLGISRRSIQRMQQRAALKSSQKMIVSRVRPAGIRDERVQRCRYLYRLYTFNDVKLMCFHGEKVFTLEVPSYRQNNGVSSLESPISLKLMVSCCISWEGKTQIFFVNPQKTKVKSSAFIDHLERDLLPACEVLFPDGDFILVLDGATSHTATKTQRYLSTYAPRFIPAEKWPPYSPELNPMEYYVWDALQEKVYGGHQEPFANLLELSARITECWALIPQEDIRKAVSQWKRRLNCVIRANGEQITLLNN